MEDEKIEEKEEEHPKKKSFKVWGDPVMSVEF